MERLVLTSFQKGELEKLIIDCMTNCLKANNQKPTIEIPKNDEDLLTKKEAAQLLKCSTSTVDNYARSGILTRFYLGRSVRFKRKELLQLIK